ncbi:MAG TPA: SDR family oxidoreductase, partial [Chroococcales cyanobacterium]
MSNSRLSKNFAGVITGASTGIGKALAVRLARDFQARLVINARTEQALESTRKLIEQHGGEAIVVAGDVGVKDVAAGLVKTCIARFGTIDLLVNNAGLARPGTVTRLQPEDWEAVFAVNFFAPLYATYAALPAFAEKGAGKIVNISSVAGKVAFPGSVCYAASKFALTGMSEGMAAELANQGIDVLTVCPGWVRTEFFSKNSVIDEKNPTLIAA